MIGIHASHIILGKKQMSEEWQPLKCLLNDPTSLAYLPFRGFSLLSWQNNLGSVRMDGEDGRRLWESVCFNIISA